MHVDAGGVDVVRIELAHLDELLDLGDGDLGRRGHHRVEVHRRVPVDEVAEAVASPRLDDREVAADGRLEHVGAPVELARLLLRRVLGDRPVRRVAHGQAAVAHGRAGAGRRVERRDAGAARAQALGERALRRELDLELAREVLPLELLVLADVARDHLRDLLVPEQRPEPEVVDPAVVRHDGEALGAELAQRADAVLGDSAEPEAAREERRAVGDVAHRVERGRDYLVHRLLGRR